MEPNVEKWKHYQKEYVKKNRDKLNSYGRDYYQKHKDKFKEYYVKYKKKLQDKKNGVQQTETTKNAFIKKLEREKRKNEILLERARQFRDTLASQGHDPACLGTF